MNLDTVLQGLSITVVGMGLTFLALGLIVLSMVLMGRFLRPKPAQEGGVTQTDALSEERAKVAAMVAAIVAAGAGDQYTPAGAWEPSSQRDTPSPWQASHRARALSRRT